MAVATTLWKCGSLASITQEFWNDRGQFVKIRSIQMGLSGFL